MEKNQIPVITIGRYRGMKIDSLPNSYLRWMMGQDFPKEWLECAKEKLANSDFDDTYLSISRHAIDMFSKRFLSEWVKDNQFLDVEKTIGLCTYMVNRAQEAWEKGSDTSKHRHEKDGVIRSYRGIQWVFNINPKFPDYKDVITVMDSD